MSAQDDNMRLVAEVVDKFSTPLKNLRSGLQQMGREGAQHADAVQKSFGRVESAAKVAGQTVGTVLNPALAAVGITGLTAAGAVAAVGTALRGFSSATSQLVYLSRETGIATDKLRELEALGGKVGLAPEAMAGSIQRFAENARAIKKGVGEISGFLQSQNPVVARWASELQKDLQAGLDPAEAYKRSLKFMQAIRDPIEKGIFAERVLGNKALARLGFEDVDKLVAEIQREIGKLPKDAEKNALAFERAIDGMGQSLRSLRDIIGAEIAPVITEMTNDVAHFVQENREGFRVSVVESIRAVRDALKEVDWKETKEAAGAVFGAIADGARQTGTVIRSMALTLGALKDLKDGNFSEAFRKFGEVDRATDMGMGRRSNAEPSQKPSAKDEALDAMLRGQSPAGVADARRKADITAVERELRTKQDELGYQQRRFPVRDDAAVRKLTEEVGKLSGELKRLREAMPDKKPGEATVQQQSFDQNGSTFGGARVQTAAFGGGFGGMARVGRALSGHGGGGGAGGASLPADPEAGMPGRGGVPRGGRTGPAGPGEDGRAPRSAPGLPGRSFGGGRFNGLGPGTQVRPGGPGDRVRRRMQGEPETMPTDRGMLDLISRAEGTLKRGYDDSFAHQYKGTLTDKTLGEVQQIQRGMRGSSAIGRYQFMQETLFGNRRKGVKGLVDELGIDRNEKFTPEMQDRLGNALIERRYKEAQRMQRRHGGDFMTHFRTALAREWASFPGDYGQKGINGGMYPGQRASISRQKLTEFAQRWLDQREGRVAKGGAGEKAGGEKADGEGWAKRRGALRNFEAEEQGQAFTDAVKRRQAEAGKRRLDFGGDGGKGLLGRALRSGVMGGRGGDVNGSVQVTVAKPGPDTKVSTSTSGSLFKDVKLNTGRTMVRASENG